jgi:hypothetical protein
LQYRHEEFMQWVEWATDSDNPEAQQFYAELGVPIKESKIFYRVEDSELARLANP